MTTDTSTTETPAAEPAAAPTVAPLAFIDTETTGVHRKRRAWEVAIIRREPDGTEQTLHAFVSDVDLSRADPYGLRVGRFYERHPNYNGTVTDLDCWPAYTNRSLPDGVRLLDECQTAVRVEQMTRGAHLIGAVPNFDAEVFADMLRRHRLTPAWHYHLIDVENLAVGYLAFLLAQSSDHARREIGDLITPPYSSQELSRMCGVDLAGADERHTALGDAKWARRLYDAIIAGRAS